jgi:hypothetical protein
MVQVDGTRQLGNNGAEVGGLDWEDWMPCKCLANAAHLCYATLAERPSRPAPEDSPPRLDSGIDINARRYYFRGVSRGLDNPLSNRRFAITEIGRAPLPASSLTTSSHPYISHLRHSKSMANPLELKRPPFEDLPLDKSGPPGNAWGLYGANDELGSLNQLTPAVVASAAGEIKTGERVSLDWSLDNPVPPFFNRQPVNRQMKRFGTRFVNDDNLSFNTQCGSQWDGA